MVDENVGEERRDFYVYVIFRPDGRVCYIGKGSGDRCMDHLRNSHNRYLSRIIKKANGNVPIVLVREGICEADAFATEIALIAAIGRISNHTGPLLNLTNGGEGVVGHRRTGRQRAAMSVARKGIRISAEAAAKVSAALKGRPKTPEHCAAVSAAKKGKSQGPLSQAHRDAIGRAHKGRKRSPSEIEACRRGQAKVDKALKSARISAALTGKRLTEEHRKNISRVQQNMTDEQKTARREKQAATRLRNLATNCGACGL